MAIPYIQPARGGKLPFLTLEIESEVTGGTLWYAENRAAGSGSTCVNALRWLLKQASPSEISSTDCVAFTASVTRRSAIFHVHFYSESHFHMSHLRTFCTMNPGDIRDCHNLVKNILDYGLTTRLSIIKKGLAQLYPVPEHWKTAGPATAESTPVTERDENARPSKNSEDLQGQKGLSFPSRHHSRSTVV